MSGIRWTAEQLVEYQRRTAKSARSTAIVDPVVSKHIRAGKSTGGPVSNHWSDDEIFELRAAYAKEIAKNIDLAGLAIRLGRNKANVCRKARELGLTNKHRRKVDVRVNELKKYSTKEERSAAISRSRKEWIAKNGHPRGSLGLLHTAETKAKLSEKSKARWANPNSGLNSERVKQLRSDNIYKLMSQGKMRGGGYSRTRGGKREDLGGVYFRSAWEANYARYLNWMIRKGEIVSWDFEPKTFFFESIKRGTRAYTPDFRVVSNNGTHEWHEVKGWMDAASKTRLARFAKFYPDEKLIVVGVDWFRNAAKDKLGAIISPHWEGGTTR